MGPWTRDKLKILALYLPGYLAATKKALERIYIDAFAGPGLNRLRGSGVLIDGSPLIALDAKKAGVRFSQLFFIEKDPGTASELRALLQTRDPERRSTVVTGDVNTELPRIVRGFNQKAPIFIFSDTEGIEPHWSTLAAVSQWRTELLLNFPLGMSINRNPDSQKARDFFGTGEWREVWNTQSARNVIDLYKARLKELGYRHTTQRDRLIRTGSGRRLYYLIHVSKKVEAVKIMDWVLDQPDAAGQSRFPFPT